MHSRDALRAVVIDDQVSEMTRQAMGGKVPFEAVFARRLDLIQPTRKQLDTLGKLYTETLVEDALHRLAQLDNPDQLAAKRTGPAGAARQWRRFEISHRRRPRQRLRQALTIDA